MALACSHVMLLVDTFDFIRSRHPIIPYEEGKCSTSESDMEEAPLVGSEAVPHFFLHDRYAYMHYIEYCMVECNSRRFSDVKDKGQELNHRVNISKGTLSFSQWRVHPHMNCSTFSALGVQWAPQPGVPDRLQRVPNSSWIKIDIFANRGCWSPPTGHWQQLLRGKHFAVIRPIGCHIPFYQPCEWYGGSFAKNRRNISPARWQRVNLRAHYHLLIN